MSLLRAITSMAHAHLDILAAVRSQLPRELSDKVTESEAVLGKRVVFFEDPSIPGAAGGAASPVRLEFPILWLNPGLRQRCVAPDV